MMKPITLNAVQIRGPKSIPKEIREAFKLCTDERKGACHIELPADVALEEVNLEPHKAVTVRRAIPDEKAVRLAVDQIENAKRPVIIVSSRGQRNSVHRALRHFCDQTNIYVVHTQLGKGVLGDDHKNSLYSFGIHKKDHVSCVVERADLIITIGYSTVEYPPSVWNKDLQKNILHIDFTPADADIYYSPQTELVGDMATSLDLIALGLNEYTYDDTYNQKLKKKLDHVLFEDKADDISCPLKPRRIVADCRAVLGEEDIICMDNGVYKLWFSRHYKTFNIGTFLLDNALGSMGAGLPSAMAAQIVYPERNVLAVCGDGGFMMNSQELETAVRLGLNVVVLLLRDNGYGFIKWEQERYKYESYGLDFGNPDFVKYAEAYGAIGMRIEKADDLVPMLKKAFSLKKPVLIDCPIDYSENLKMWGEHLDGITCEIE